MPQTPQGESVAKPEIPLLGAPTSVKLAYWIVVKFQSVSLLVKRYLPKSVTVVPTTPNTILVLVNTVGAVFEVLVDNNSSFLAINLLWQPKKSHWNYLIRYSNIATLNG